MGHAPDDVQVNAFRQGLLRHLMEQMPDGKRRMDTIHRLFEIVRVGGQVAIETQPPYSQEFMAAVSAAAVDEIIRLERVIEGLTAPREAT